MLAPLRNPTYRRLLAAQVVALLGTGLATVALGLLAFDLAGADAGAVLGTALAIKMIAYVGIAPVAQAFAVHLPRRGFLVAMDLVRAAIVLLLPFIDAVWQVYLLIFLLQSASAAFTPAFQATIPEVLPDERDYTRALSLSRLAYDTESLVSPVLAAAMLAVIDFHWLFAATAIGFGASAALVLSTTLPMAAPGPVTGGLYGRITRGARIYLATPRLRGLLALNLAAAAGGAMVIVNTVVHVRSALGRPEADVAVALAAFGAGSMAAALILPRLLDRLADRPVMVAGGMAVTVVLAAAGVASLGGPVAWPVLLGAWVAMGVGYSSVLTPSGRLLRRSADAADRPAVFAAQFALSHACWLVTYPVSGWLGKALGLGPAMLVLAAIAALGLAAALRFWPAGLPDEPAHSHEDLPADHPHLAGASHSDGRATHAHPYVIDDLHRRWPG